MIEELINQTIDAAKQDRSAKEKTASEAKVEKESFSPVVASLRKLAAQVRKEASLGTTEPKEEPINTKVAEESSDMALKGLTLLKRYAEGSYAS